MPDEQAPILTIERCEELFENVQASAKSLGVPDVEVIFGAQREALTRFANNSIHQNVAEQAQFISVRVLIDHQTARATTNRFDRASVRSVVEQAVALTKSASPDANTLPLTQPGPVPQIPRFDPDTAVTTPLDRARIDSEAIRVVEGAGQTAAGIYSTGQSIEAIFNSQRVAAWHAETMAN